MQAVSFESLFSSYPFGNYNIWSGPFYKSSGTQFSANVINQFGANLVIGYDNGNWNIYPVTQSLQSGIYVSNLNDATDANRCYYADGNTTNKPTGVASWLLVRVIGKSGAYISQIATEENVLNGRMWYRTKTQLEWGIWHEVTQRTAMQKAEHNLHTNVSSADVRYELHGRVCTVTFSIEVKSGTTISAGQKILSNLTLPKSYINGAIFAVHLNNVNTTFRHVFLDNFGTGDGFSLVLGQADAMSEGSWRGVVTYLVQ